MYERPQLIWVAALVAQSLPALAIFEPGSACGMPVAPLPAL
jgi:hypothetical protein